MKKYVSLLTFLFLFVISLSHATTPPKANEAFQVTVNLLDANTFLLNIAVKSGFFLYKDKVTINNPESTQQMTLTPIKLPESVPHKDSQGVTQQVLQGSFSLPVYVLSENGTTKNLSFNYQGCASDGFCYPPITKNIQMNFGADHGLTAVQFTDPKAKTTFTTAESSSKETSILANQHWFIALLTFYGLGLLLAFTPCVLPMLPIISTLILKQEKRNTVKSLWLSGHYVLGMSVTYAIIGGVIAALGENLQLYLQTPLINIVAGTIFILLGLSMLDLLPMAVTAPFAYRIQQKIATSKGGAISAFFVGALSTLILSPCVTAPLIGVLGYIAQSGDKLYGILTLFVLSLGMGTPLMLIAASAGHVLPKQGQWMVYVKKILGLGLFLVAYLLLARAFPILLGTNDHQFSPDYTVTTPAMFDSLLTKPHKKPLLLDVYATWCTSCLIMEKTLFSNKEIQNMLSQFTVVKVDLSGNTHESQVLMKKLEIIAPPTFIVLTAQGKELPNQRSVGELSSDEFKKLIIQQPTGQ